MSKKYAVSILGEKYTVHYKSPQEEPKFEDSLCDGYCDTSTKDIVIRDSIIPTANTIANPESYLSKVLRHELIHAFLFESGLDENSWARNEEIVDWFALQFDKIRDTVDWIESLKSE